MAVLFGMALAMAVLLAQAPRPYAKPTQHTQGTKQQQAENNEGPENHSEAPKQEIKRPWSLTHPTKHRQTRDSVPEQVPTGEVRAPSLRIPHVRTMFVDTSAYRQCFPKLTSVGVNHHCQFDSFDKSILIRTQTQKLMQGLPVKPTRD